MNKSILCITLGDPVGVGPELVLQIIQKKIVKNIQLVVIANKFILQHIIKLLKITIPINEINFNDKNWVFKNDALNFYNVQLNIKNQKFQFGKPNKFTSLYSYAFIVEAVKLAKHGFVHGLVTNPVNKQQITKAGIPFVGHTELLAKLTNTKKYYMTFIGPKGMMSLLTTHIRLKQVSNQIKKEKIIENFCATFPMAQKLYGDNIKAVIMGVNPHSGEGGLFGNEEIKEITPAIRYLKKKVPVDGPIPSDSFWGFVYKRTPYKFVLSMYHDQGLIPVKMGVFGRTVNTTVGLPFIRTSVDHGTAYDIAGKHIADIAGLKQAIEYAKKMI